MFRLAEREVCCANEVSDAYEVYLRYDVEEHLTSCCCSETMLHREQGERLHLKRETGYWLELLYKTRYIDENEYSVLENACRSIRVMLLLSFDTPSRGVHTTGCTGGSDFYMS